MSTIELLETEKKRSIAVFVSSNNCIEACRDFISKNKDKQIYLAALKNGTSYSPRKEDAHSLRVEEIADYRDEKNDHVYNIIYSRGVDPALLASVKSVYWFFDEQEEHSYPVDSAGYSCCLNVALAQGIGLPVTVFNEKGEEITSPLNGEMHDDVTRELRVWKEYHTLQRTKAIRKGIRLAPDWCEPALWSSSGGGMEAGCFELPIELIWRIRRLEKWVDLKSHVDINGSDSWTDEGYDLLATEIEQCAKALEDELQIKIPYEDWREE
ncbi:hypothetical protein [Terasakiella pusilla]|uniref:hypothetical protein n=1 Tax=Terasakiella pusilla TaxID=64973 RepID=UPI003AA83F9E